MGQPRPEPASTGRLVSLPGSRMASLPGRVSLAVSSQGVDVVLWLLPAARGEPCLSFALGISRWDQSWGSLAGKEGKIFRRQRGQVRAAFHGESEKGHCCY